MQYTWNRDGALQDWLIRFPLQIDFKRQSLLFVRRAESMERFAGLEFREHENWISFSTSYLRWMDFFVAVSNGMRPNFFRAEGIAPFLADFRDGQVGLTFSTTLPWTRSRLHKELPAGGRRRIRDRSDAVWTRY